MRRSLVETASLEICGPHLHRGISGSQGVLPCVGWGVTASQLDLLSLTSLSVAGCDRLQLGASRWDTSVGLLQVICKYTASIIN